MRRGVMNQAEMIRSAGMDDALGHALPVEACELLDQRRVLKQDGAKIARRLRVAVLSDRRTIVAGHLRRGGTG